MTVPFPTPRPMTNQTTTTIAYYGRSSKAPQCTEGRHDWSIDRGVQGRGDANIYADQCTRCHSRRYRRRSYRACADPHRATGDGRDWTRYEEAYEVVHDDTAYDLPDYTDDEIRALEEEIRA